MSNKLKVTIIQYDIEWNNVSANLSILEKMLKKTDNSDLIIFPEVFDTGFVTDINILEKDKRNTAIEWLRRKSTEFSTALAGSSLTLTQAGYKNRFLFSIPDRNIEFYDKRHLFSMAEENKFIQKGFEHKIVDYKNWKINLQICYDLRFPVWSRNTNCYDLMIYVANWPASRIYQWKSLLIARAIENQAFVIGVNRIGKDANGFAYSGKSLIINYKGDIIYEAPENIAVSKTVELELDKLRDVRKKFPVLNDADNFKIIH